jgi:hypothetical protein
MLKLAIGEETAELKHQWFLKYRCGVMFVKDGEPSGHPSTSKAYRN